MFSQEEGEYNTGAATESIELPSTSDLSTFTSLSESSDHLTGMIFHLPVGNDDHSQKSHGVISNLVGVFKCIHELFGDIKTAYIRADGASTFADSRFALSLRYMKQWSGIHVSTLEHNEAGCGKSPLDSSFKFVLDKVTAYRDEGNDVVTGEQYHAALCSGGAIVGTFPVLVICMDDVHNPPIKIGKAAFPNIQRVRKIEYAVNLVDGLRYWEASDIGPGVLFTSVKLDAMLLPGSEIICPVVRMRTRPNSALRHKSSITFNRATDSLMIETDSGVSTPFNPSKSRKNRIRRTAKRAERAKMLCDRQDSLIREHCDRGVDSVAPLLRAYFMPKVYACTTLSCSRCFVDQTWLRKHVLSGKHDIRFDSNLWSSSMDEWVNSIKLATEKRYKICGNGDRRVLGSESVDAVSSQEEYHSADLFEELRASPDRRPRFEISMFGISFFFFSMPSFHA